MRKEKVLCPICLLAGVLMVCWSGSAVARQTIFTGGIGTGFNYTDRTYDGDAAAIGDNAGDREDYSIWPDFQLESIGIHNTLLLHYRPELTYDNIDSESNIDHSLDLDWQHQISSKWSYMLTDNYVYSSNPNQADDPFDTGDETTTADDLVPPDDLTQNFGTQRYWENRLNFSTTYSYGPGSLYQLGYNYRILRNDSDSDGAGAYDEFDRHGVSLLWAHRYTSAWRSQLDLNYYKGIFDEPSDTGLSQDLDEYRADVQVDYVKSTTSFFPMIYKYQQTNYEDDLREDISAHELTFGWDHTFDTRNHLLIGAGPSYVESENLDGEIGYNYIVHYTRTYLHGRFDVLVNKRYLTSNFTGGTDTGLSDTTDIRLSTDYQISRDIAFNIFGQYTYREILNPEGEYYTAGLGGGDPAAEDELSDITYTRKSITAGTSVSYNILRWLVGSLGYVYYKQDGDVATDSYDDHRVVLSLTASTELWRN